MENRNYSITLENTSIKNTVVTLFGAKQNEGKPDFGITKNINMIVEECSILEMLKSVSDKKLTTTGVRIESDDSLQVKQPLFIKKSDETFMQTVGYPFQADQYIFKSQIKRDKEKHPFEFYVEATPYQIAIDGYVFMEYMVMAHTKVKLTFCGEKFISTIVFKEEPKIQK